MTVSNTPPVIVDKAPVVKDSLKFAGTDTTFSIVDIVPSSDSAPSQGTAYSAQIEDMLSTIKALQVARKSLSQAQSLVKDIKSNYKVEKYDEWSPLDDSLLLQRRGFMLQIREIFEKALYDNQNVFTMDYASKGVNIDLDKHDLKGLNLRDGHSIDIFSYNLQALSKQMDNEIGNLQKKIDSINQTRWLPESQLKSLPLEQKTVSADNSKAIPNLASLLAATPSPLGSLLGGAPTSAAASPSPLEEGANKIANQDSTAPKDNATETMKEAAKPEEASLATSSAQDAQADTQDKSNEAMQEDTTKAPKAGDAPSENKETSPASNEGSKDGEGTQGIDNKPNSKTTSVGDSAPTSQGAQSETKEDGAEVSTESKDAKAPESKEDSPQVGATNDSKPSESSQATLSESGKQDEPKEDSKAIVDDKDSNSAPSQDAPSIATASPSDATNASNLEASTTSAELGAEAKTDSKDAPQANLATNTPSPDGATDTATNDEDKKDEQKPSAANNKENEENKKEEKQASQATPNEETKPSDGGDTMLVIENA